MARLVDLNWWLDEQMPFVPEKMQVGVGRLDDDDDSDDDDDDVVLE